ncbi:hypothetical protein JD292_11280 [Leucobacter sp. CSA2]|uniref:Uncharacterized protein n=1 Tax=Leucobacter edaphi TaxID=2796472 RepID=A0A934QE60_9MICO|nr:DUF6264 family protein [Leucobacter edaphi]MBK0422653.1 hypothetical protein [Leucobacter edaphi]
MPAPETEHPEEQPQAQPAAQQQPERPRPEYGEYAPDGWSWTPPGAEETTPGAPAGAAATATDASGRTGVPAGVPHNLGARPTDGQAPQRSRVPSAGAQRAPGANPTSGDPAPYRATSPGGPAHQAPQSQPQQAQQPQQPQQPRYAPAQGKPRTADRVITIILLAIGAFGALNLAASGFAIVQQMHLMGEMIGLEKVTVPEWVGPVGTVAGLVVLLVYALNVIYSIQRIRANKLAFWVPLVAAGIAFVVIMAVSMIAMASIPDLMQTMNSDPYGSLDRMMKYVEETPTP